MRFPAWSNDTIILVNDSFIHELEACLHDPFSPVETSEERMLSWQRWWIELRTSRIS